MKKILWVSLTVPYDTVGHAGGKVHNFYLKEMKKLGLYDIFLISFCSENESSKLDLEEYQIPHSLIYYKEDFVSKVKKELVNLPRKINMFDKNGGFSTIQREYRLMKKLKEYKAGNHLPDIIIIQWTEIALLLPQIKKIFPKAKYVCIEEDVAYLGKYRKFQYCNNFLKKIYRYTQFKNLKKSELNVLQESDLVIVNNFKDEELITQEGIQANKIYRACPYFDSYDSVKREYIEKNIIFYGAMNRLENIESVIWFIENVFNKLGEEYKFWIVGNRPSEKILRYKSERIIVTGFVEDVSEIFKQAFCLVAPLVLGAGIKIKVLEAMSAGIPVLTNDIGIEGIGAAPDKEYFHCKTAEDYIKSIKQLNCEEVNLKVGNSGRIFLKQNFNKYEKIIKMSERINAL